MRKSILHISDTALPDICKIKIGQPVKFIPASYYKEPTAAPGNGRPIYPCVVGTICYIHWAHRYFTVSYTLQNRRFLESFKF